MEVHLWSLHLKNATSTPLGQHVSSALGLSTGAPQGCVLSPLLYTTYTYVCNLSSSLGVDESVYREEVDNVVHLQD